MYCLDMDDSPDVVAPQVDKRLLVELLILGGLLVVGQASQSVPVLEGMAVRDLLRLGQPRIVSVALITLAGLALPVAVLMRMTIWNHEGIDFGFKRVEAKRILVWSIVNLGALILAHFIFRLFYPVPVDATGNGTSALAMWINQLQQFPDALWSFCFSTLGALVAPIITYGYLQGLLFKLLRHTDLTPWVVALLCGAATLPVQNGGSLVYALFTGAVLAWSRYLSKSTWPAAIGFCTYFLVRVLLF